MMVVDANAGWSGLRYVLWTRKCEFCSLLFLFVHCCLLSLLLGCLSGFWMLIFMFLNCWIHTVALCMYIHTYERPPLTISRNIRMPYNTHSTLTQHSKMMMTTIMTDQKMRMENANAAVPKTTSKKTHQIIISQTTLKAKSTVINPVPTGSCSAYTKSACTCSSNNS